MLGLITAIAVALTAGFVAALAWQRIRGNPLQAEADGYRSQLLLAEQRALGLEQRLTSTEADLATIREQRSSEGAALSARVAEVAAQLQHSQADLVTRDQQLTAQLRRSDELLNRAVQAEKQASALESTLAAVQKQLEAQKHWIEEQKTSVREEVQNVASKILEEKAVKLTAQNAEQLSDLLNPLRDQLGDFRRKIEQVAETGARDHTALRVELGNMQTLTRSIVDQTSNLTNALTHSAKAQGDWGEMILRRALEQSGLRKNGDYKLQCDVQAADDEATRRQRPDAVIFMPEDRQLVIDAKVSLTAWQEFRAATDKAGQGEALKRHLHSLRTHVRDLAGRDYSSSPDLTAVDFTIMFVPIEAALLEALQADFGIYEEAFRRKVILVSPTTLFAVLKLVEGIWRVARREQHAEQIVDVGRKLFEKLCNFADTFEEAIHGIAKAKESIEKAKGQLTSGRGNAMKLAQDLLELGVSTSKRLPKGYMPGALLADVDAEDGLPGASANGDAGAPAVPH
jgi:DNA recombination protein RmuC